MAGRRLRQGAAPALAPGQLPCAEGMAVLAVPLLCQLLLYIKKRENQQE